MLLVACVDLDDDIGRKTGIETPVIGREAVESAAVQLATSDPEDSDVNVLFEGIRVYDDLSSQNEPVAIAAITGTAGNDVAANRKVGQELDLVLDSFDQQITRALVVTDGAQDESVLPVIRTRVPVNGVRRVVVRQAQNLESVYYTIKQVLADPETRGTIPSPSVSSSSSTPSQRSPNTLVFPAQSSGSPLPSSGYTSFSEASGSTTPSTNISVPHKNHSIPGALPSSRISSLSSYS
jgi:hypothetical protein